MNFLRNLRQLWKRIPRAGRTALNRQRLLRLPGLGLIALACLSAAAWGWPQEGKGPAAAKSRGSQKLRVDECRIKMPEEVILAFDRAGLLGEMDVEEGDLIESGKRLASLKDDAARAAFNVARIQADSEVEIRYARLAAAEAKTEHEKMVEGNRKKAGTTPELEVQRALLNFQKAEAEVEKAIHNQKVLEAKRDEAQVLLDTFRLDAPFAGVVTKVHHVKGASVKQGDPVVELVNIRKVRVEGSVSLKEIALVRPGCAVEVQLHGDNIGEELAARTFAGKIIFVDPAKVLSAGERVRVTAEVDNSEMLLRDGLNASMVIHSAASQD
jgi:multidrug resistance efflux pump